MSMQHVYRSAIMIRITNFKINFKKSLIIKSGAFQSQIAEIVVATFVKLCIYNERTMLKKVYKRGEDVAGSWKCLL